MRGNHFLIERLRGNLEAILRQEYSPKQLNDVVILAHSIAVSFLDIKSAAGSINREYFHLSNDDAAYDCIADLFRRDDSNKILALNVYFSAFQLDALNDYDLLSHLRRLVFTKVNDGVARLYRQSDPMLSRILRNIRLAVQSLDIYVHLERFGEQYLAPSMCDFSEHLPKLDEQTLEGLLLSNVRGDENVMEIVGKLALALRGQEEYCRMVNIMQIAVAIRSLYSRKALVQYSPSAFQNNGGQDLFEIIRSSIARIQKRLYPKYVHKGKVDEQTYLLYFDVIEKKIKQMMIDGSANGQSLFHVMQQSAPALTEEHYRKEHKSRLEYLFKLSCDKVAKEIQK